MADQGTLSEEVRLQVLLRRLEVHVAGATPAVVSGLVSIAILVFTFFEREWVIRIALWAGLASAMLMVRLAQLSRVDLASRDYASLRRSFNRVSGANIAMSALWGIGFPLFAQFADGVEFAVLVLVGMAAFAGVLLMHRTMPVAARAHVALVGGGLIAAAWIALGGAAWMVVVLVGLYAVTLWAAIGRQDRVFKEAVANQVLRQDAAETVALLLHDYEQHSSDWLWTVGPLGNMRSVSERFAEAANSDSAALEGKPLIGLFLPGEARDRLARHIVERSPFRDLVLKLRIEGELRYWRLSAQPRADGRLSGVARDVTTDRLIEERVAFMAHFDNLTGLANRYLFNERLRKSLSSDQAGDIALFYLDLDDFKAINDTRGHIVGDRLLREVGTRLEQEVRPEDLVARLGGDEFAILIETRAGTGMLIERAHRFLSVVREPYEIEGQHYRISTSVGVARCGGGECDAEELMRRADLALFAAKAKGRDNLAIFDAELDRAAKERRETEADLREAIARGQMRLHYQPVIDLNTGRTTGYEALLRWYHPTRGIVGPNDFLHIAEASGMIVPLGDWIIRQALAETASWPADMRIAVNLSPTQVRSPHLVTVVAQAIHAHAIAPERIEFEITEHVLLEEGEASHATLMKLRELGTRIALDDFGTGYSSLGYLRRFPFDRIKIDRHFVEGIEGSTDNQAIVSTITRLAEALGMSTTAEGIESRGQLDLLRKLGCQEAQGFLICRPVPSESLVVGEGESPELVDLAGEVLDYRKTREAALRKKGSRVA